MRFIASILVTAALFGAVALTQRGLTRQVDFRLTREAEEHGHGHAESEATGTYSLRVTLGFDAARDPFALPLDDAAPTPRVLVRHGDTAILSETRDLQRGGVLSVPDLGFSGEAVALYVEATPNAEDAARPCGLRVQLFQGEALCDETTLWSGGDGLNVSGEVRLSLHPRLERLDRGLTAGGDE